MFRTIRNFLIFPVAFLYVAVFVFYYFVKLFLEGYYVDNIIQILFVKMNHRLSKLVYRATWLTPFVYGFIILKIALLFLK